MSVTPGNLSLNGTSFFTENHSIVDKPSEQRTWNVFLFCLTFATALPALLGSIYSLVSLLKLQNKTTLSMIVTSLAADDLISIVPVIIFMLMQWSSEVLPQPLCTTSAFMYLFHGISSNLKGSLVVSYNFYTLNTTGTLSCSSSKRRVSVVWAILTTWTVGLLMSILPLCGWGRYIPTSWGCFADCASSYVLFVFAVYSLCFSLLAVLAVPLTLRLLCSGEPRPPHPEHLRGSGGFISPGTPWGCGAAAPPPPLLEPGDKALQPFQNSEAVFGKGVAESSAQSRSFTVGFAQKRFSLILALTKVLLWLPMMIQMAVQYMTGLQSLSLETLSFLLTVLAATVTPVFVLSQHWLHLPCGCIINCRRSSYAVSSQDATTKRSGFEFKLSFQQGYGIYRISQESPPHHSSDGKSSSHHSLVSPDCEEQRPGRGTGIPPLALGHGSQDSLGGTGTAPAGSGACQVQEGTKCDPSAFPEGPEWRLFHEESHTPELSDWEWCRSKSERNPRQRAAGALAVPLCAFQGTVSLQAPGGKTLSLSTYEVSSQGQKITPTSKKIEVYRSKSVGHEPSPGEPRDTFADTSVKIHLEVLEICDNEEALDTVSIISNISQSSTQARSPSLRYSRKENRFVCCELGESASYSLLIPSHSPGSDFSISIPDTVEAHRRNSQKQQSARAGYQEEIQLLNKAYREREEQGSGS
ncbi:PREDICTED: probable G-protein coupled receptor 149 [Pseudopodoces humilis]|uniref:probable G-protein coupled receptor 149 n=1 Tax=Pseudopodoces humilis TaxID=181119 RepID=UPI000395DD1D|nr:PREDICTED: probable G-protein coupled receptor 149 [Pseudopodoces humilis]